MQLVLFCFIHRSKRNETKAARRFISRCHSKVAIVLIYYFKLLIGLTENIAPKIWRTGIPRYGRGTAALLVRDLLYSLPQSSS